MSAPDSCSLSPLSLATKEELAIELTSRADTPALVIYRVKTKTGQVGYGYSHNFPTKDALPDMLRELARFFDACEKVNTSELS